MNSASERALAASRAWAATDVPERSVCLAQTWTSSRSLGQLHIKSNDKSRKLFCSRPEFVGQPSLSPFRLCFIPKAFRFHFPFSTFHFPLFPSLDCVHESNFDVVKKDYPNE